MNQNPFQIDEKLGFISFYSLVRPKADRKARKCLRCAVVFVSRDSGNRCCSVCSGINARHAKLAKYAIQ